LQFGLRHSRAAGTSCSWFWPPHSSALRHSQSPPRNMPDPESPRQDTAIPPPKHRPMPPRLD
jgi:hypothetical protein